MGSVHKSRDGNMGFSIGVNKAVKDHKNNIVLDDFPHPINDSEKEILSRKERITLAQLRSGYCKLLGSYKSRIKKDASLDVCADCGKTPHDGKHLFACQLEEFTNHAIKRSFIGNYIMN